MAKGIIYVMSTAADGLIKIGKTQEFEKRMKFLESNGYYNIAGLKRQFAIELEDYDEKESLIHNIFSKSQIGSSELFSVDVDLAKQLLSAFDGRIIYPKESKEKIFIKATDSLIEKEEIKKLKHHFDSIKFSSSLTNKEYETCMGENGVLVLKDLSTNQEVPNKSNPSKKQIVRQALLDLGEVADNDKTLYQLTHLLIKKIKGRE